MTRKRLVLLGSVTGTVLLLCLYVVTKSSDSATHGADLALAQTAAQYQSIVWTTSPPTLYGRIARTWPSGGSKWVTSIGNPSVSISYRAGAFEIAPNGSISRVLQSGDTLAEGARVLYRFSPHSYTDIYWTGTGGAHDTPYGDWVAGMGALPASRCVAKNLYRGPVAANSDGDFSWFAQLSVSPPAKAVSVAGTATRTCTPSGASDLLCTYTSGGTASASMVFGATSGRFYTGMTVEYRVQDMDCGMDGNKPCGTYGQPTLSSCAQNDYPMGTGSGVETDFVNTYQNANPYTLQVPARSLAYNFTIQPANTAPTAPTVTPAASCVIGSPHTISMRSTDPDGNSIRYAIDWDNNGTIDQYVPASGYVSSGTTQSASRTHTSTPTPVRVWAIDQNGAGSSLTTTTFSCAYQAPTASIAQSPTSATVTIGQNGHVIVYARAGGGTATSCQLRRKLNNGAYAVVQNGSGSSSNTYTATPTYTNSSHVGTWTYEASCTGPGGTSPWVVVTKVVAMPGPPIATISQTPASGNIIIGQGTVHRVAWSRSGGGPATSCQLRRKLDNGAYTTVQSNGSGTDNNTYSITYNATGVGTWTYEASCTGLGGTSPWVAVSIPVVHPAPTLSLSANPTIVGYQETSGLTWSTANVETNTCSASSNPSGLWSGTKANSGSGVATPPILVNSTFTLRCIGLNGNPIQSTASVSMQAGTGACVLPSNLGTCPGGPSSPANPTVNVEAGDSVSINWHTGTSDPAHCVLRAGDTVLYNVTTQSGTRSWSVPQGETVITLDCESGGNSDSFTVQVIADLYET